jgi:hypothetical protein
VYEGSFFPASSPTFVVAGVLYGSNSNRSEWNLSVVLICISFMARAFFMCFLVIWTYYFEKVLFSSFAHFFISLLILAEFSFLSSLYTLLISPLCDV